MSPEPPADDEVIRGLEEALRSEGAPAGVVGIERVPYPYATSYPLEEVTAHLSDGRTLSLVLKDLTWDRLLGEARRSKPRFLYEPRRCIETYRRILAGTGLGAAYHGAFTDEDSGRYWLLIEKVPGVELWQIGELAVWESVARWLARFHQRFLAEREGVAQRNPYLLRHDPDFLRMWPGRALDAVVQEQIGSDRLRGIAAIVDGYGPVVDTLAGGPQVFIHGELYPSNVLVAHDDAGEARAVWPIDWEMAAVGPPLLDLAALTAGWKGEEQARLVDAYLEEIGPAAVTASGDDPSTVLDCCRLHYAFQWLGWSSDWVPPAEHARDWVAEALALGERLGL